MIPHATIRPAQRGATTIEMTFVGIPLIFILISVFEVSRGMWMYETASTAVREGVRFASVHGVNCVNKPPGIPNQCDVTANDIVRVIRAGAGTGSTHGLDYGPTGAGGAGLDPTRTTVYFTSASTVTPLACSLDGTTGACDVQWPPDLDNAVKNVIKITVSTPFRSALSMFWPGSRPMQFGATNLSASSSDTIQF